MARRSLACTALAACLAVGRPSFAQTDASEAALAPDAPAAKDSLPITIKLASTPIQAEAVRAAIEAELGVAVRLEDRLTEEGLSVGVTWRRATVSYRSKEGEATTRSLNLPANSEQAVEVIALLAGNLARDEASELLLRLAPPPSVAETPEPATAEEPAPSPPAETAPPAAPKPEEKKEEPAAKKTEPPSKKKEELEGLIPSAFNLSLFHPVTLFDQTERRALRIEAGLVYSRVGAIEGAGFTLGYLRVENDVRGVVGSLGLTRVDGDIIGVQWSGLVSEGHGKIRGAEVGSFVALRWGNVEGAQASAIVAYAKNVYGIQASAFGVLADDVVGAQASMVTVARDVTGGQASLIGVARNIDGGQIGLVNVAKSTDVQLGFVNVAERVDGAAFGLVSIAGNGYVEPTAYLIGGSRDSYNAGVKFVAGYAYSVLALGMTSTDGEARPHFEAGGGFHFEPPLLRDAPVVDRTAVEIGAHLAYLPQDAQNPSDENLIHYRAGLGVRFVGTLWLFGGYDVSHDMQPYGDDVGQGPWAGLALF